MSSTGGISHSPPHLRHLLGRWQSLQVCRLEQSASGEDLLIWVSGLYSMILVAGGVAAVVDDGAGGAGFLLGGYLHVHTDQRRVFDEASRG